MLHLETGMKNMVLSKQSTKQYTFILISWDNYMIMKHIFTHSSIRKQGKSSKKEDYSHS